MNHTLRALLIALLIAALFYGIGSVLAFGQSLRLAFQAKSEVTRLTAELQARRVDTISARLPVIVDRLERAKTWQKSSGWIGLVPFLGKHYQTYRDALTSGLQLTRSADHFFTILSDGQRISTVSQIDFSKAGFAYLSVQPEIEQALESLLKTTESSENIAVSLLPESIAQDLKQLQIASAQLNAFLEPFLPLLKNLPALLGKDEPQDILILLQNPHELRPTGGFIGTYGKMTIDSGVVTQFYTDDIYRVDAKLVGHEQDIAPEPLQRYANLKYWYMRDANWSPDFPTSSRDILRLYGHATGEEGIDMVLAITPRIVQEFLTMTGPITVDNITFTSENLVDALQYRVEQEFWRIGLSQEDRKQVINHLAQELRRRFFSLTPEQATVFAESVKRTIAEKEILVYSTNPSIQAELSAAGWAGVVPDIRHDLVAVVDANIGALKTDRLVDRNFSYTVSQRSDGQYEAALSLTYKNRGHFDYRTTRYRTYTRVYVPIGSELLSVNGLMLADKSPANARALVYAELGKTVFAGFVSIEPGQERTVQYNYLLPPWLSEQIDKQGRYELTVLKQPGTAPNFKATFSGSQVLRSFAPSATLYAPIGKTGLRFSQKLTADTTFQILFAQP